MGESNGTGHDDGRLHAESTRCARCGERVGLLWFQGRSTLISGPLNTDADGNLVIRRHQCDLQSTDLGPVKRGTKR